MKLTGDAEDLIDQQELLSKDFERIEHESDIIIPLLPPPINNLKKTKTFINPGQF